MVDKQDWPKPAAWAITQNESLWQEFDSIADRSIIIEWSLSDNYRTHLMEPGDRTLFWITGRNGGTSSCRIRPESDPHAWGVLEGCLREKA